MRIKFITSVAGARFSYDYDEEVELPPEVAREFLQAGQAVVVREDGVERAITSAPERAVKAVRKRFGL